MAWMSSDMPRAMRSGALLPGLREPVVAFVLLSLGAAGLLAATGAALFGPGATIAGLAVPGAGAATAAALMQRRYPHAALGACNGVTLARLALVALLVMLLLAARQPHWIVFALAALALSLDGVDGWLARRRGLTSGFGARFDMEVDSALALVLALHAWAGGGAGALVLVLGLPRYAFGAASLVRPWLARPLPDRFGRKVVCVLQLGTLIALQLPLPADMPATLLVAGVAAALAWSFGRDVLWLHRTRA